MYFRSIESCTDGMKTYVCHPSKKESSEVQGICCEYLAKTDVPTDILKANEGTEYIVDIGRKMFLVRRETKYDYSAKKFVYKFHILDCDDYSKKWVEEFTEEMFYGFGKSNFAHHMVKVCILRNP